MTTEVSKGRVVVVGPTLIDLYYIGRAGRMDQTAPIPIVDINQTMVRPGGAANAANNLAAMTMPVAFVSVQGESTTPLLGVKPEQGDMMKSYVAQVKGYHTPMKHRVYVGERLHARFDVAPVSVPVEDAVIEQFDKAVADEKPLAILISDYGCGICTEKVIHHIRFYARQHEIKIVVDPHVQNLAAGAYDGVYAITPSEAQALAGTGIANIKFAIDKLVTKMHPELCIVTLGERGMLLRQNGVQEHLPAFDARVVDTCGAGDAVAAAITYGVAANMPVSAMLQFALAAGSVAVELPGAHPVAFHEIFARLAKQCGNHTKFVSHDMAQLLRLSVNHAGGKFAIANGVFDLLHPGHMSMLAQADSEADFVLAVINSDKSAERIKRAPIKSEDERARMLAELNTVDAVLVFVGDTPEPEISLQKPDLLVKGPDYRTKPVIGAELLKEWGGQVLVTDRAFDISTTDIIARVRAADNG